MKHDKTARLLNEIHDRLYRVFGDCRCPLEHETPFQLLVAVVLSAQCRDERVNAVTPELFRRFPDAAAMSKATTEEVGAAIRSLGLWRAKAENIIKFSKILTERFGGEVPREMAELVTLPGVGRKSANAVLGNAFGVPGFPVDTHVQRLMRHFDHKWDRSTPEQLEAVVNERVAPEKWTNFSHLLIFHGRKVCHARKPECTVCVLADLCPDRGK